MIIAELNFVDPQIPVPDDSTDLAADQSLLGQVLEQRNHAVHLNSRHHSPYRAATGAGMVSLVNRGII